MALHSLRIYITFATEPSLTLYSFVSYLFRNATAAAAQLNDELAAAALRARITVDVREENAVSSTSDFV
jgi:hypothetical protein